MKRIYRVVRYRNTNKLVYGFNKKISKKKNYFINLVLGDQEVTPEISFVLDEIVVARSDSPMNSNNVEIPLNITPPNSITDGVNIVLNSDGIDVTNDINVYFVNQTIGISFDTPVGEYTIRHYSLSKPDIFAEMKLIVVIAKPRTISLFNENGDFLEGEILSMYDPNITEHTYQFNYKVEPYQSNQTVTMILPEDVDYVTFVDNPLTNIELGEYDAPTNKPIVMNITKDLLLPDGDGELIDSFEFEITFEIESPIPNEEPITFTRLFVFDVI